MDDPLKSPLPDEVCIHITGHAEVGRIYPDIGSRYAVDAGTLHGLAYDLDQLAVSRTIVDDLVLIVEARCGTNCKIYYPTSEPATQPKQSSAPITYT